MASAEQAGGLPGLVRLVLNATDTVVQAFNAVSANTSNPLEFNVNVTRSAQGFLRILDAIDSGFNAM